MPSNGQGEASVTVPLKALLLVLDLADLTSDRHPDEVAALAVIGGLADEALAASNGQGEATN